MMNNDRYLLKKGMGQVFLEVLHGSIFPNKCLFCNKVLDTVREIACEDCEKATLFVHEFRENFFDNIGMVRAAYDYDVEAVRQTIWRYKYGGNRLLVRKMACGIYDCVGEFDEPIADMLVCVPLHKGRLKERGFNQSALFAMELSRLYGVAAYDGMMRVRETAKQFDLNPKQRAENVRDAFDLKEGFCVQGKSVLIVDDVFTTGATAMECARVLAIAGAFGVGVLGFAAVEGEMQG